MKQILFSFFLICYMVIGDFKAQAQEAFAPVGAEWWYYNLRHGGGVDITYHLLYHNKVVKDTLVMGYPCRAITQTAYGRTIFWFPPNITSRTDTIALRELYVYNNSDTVFIFNENFNQFTPLYVFNVQEGDTICLPIIPDIISNSTDMSIHPYTGDRSFCFIIDSIRMVTYDTVVLRTFYNHSYLGNGESVYNWSVGDSYSSGRSGIGIYAEKIGGLLAGLLPLRDMGGAERMLNPFDYANTSFRCYTDSTMHISMISSSCDSLVPIPVNISSLESPLSGITIYPNPAKEKVTIESTQPFPVNTMVVVTDIAGKTVKIQQAGTGKTIVTMDLDNVQAGIYLLRIDAGKYSVNHKLVIYH